MGRTAGPSGMPMQRLRPKLRQKPNIFLPCSHVLFYVRTYHPLFQVVIIIDYTLIYQTIDILSTVK